MKKTILTLIVLVLSACQPQQNTIVSDPSRSGISSGGSSSGGSSDSNTGSSGGTTVPDETYNKGCTAEGNPRSSTSSGYPYIRMEAIAHGRNTVTTQIPSLAWSSNYNGKTPSTAYPGNFVTDSVLKLRIMALPSPGKGVDSFGNSCNYLELPYTQLKVTVGVREQGSSTYIDTRTLYNINVNDCSEIVTMRVPPNSLNKPFVVDIFNVKWNYSCIYTQGTSGSYGCQDNSSMTDVWDHDCVSFEVQMETDYTLQIPPK